MPEAEEAELESKIERAVAKALSKRSAPQQETSQQQGERKSKKRLKKFRNLRPAIGTKQRKTTTKKKDLAPSPARKKITMTK